MIRAKLLTHEREAAEEAARVYRDQVQELKAEVVALRAELAELRDAASARRTTLDKEVEALTEHIRTLRSHLRDSEEANHMLARENERLLLQDQEVRDERDSARGLADERYQLLELTRQQADDAQRQLRTQVVALEQEIRELRAALRRASTWPAATEPAATTELAALMAELRQALQRLQPSQGTPAGPDGVIRPPIRYAVE